VKPEERLALIRREFELARDITWAQELEPKFRENGVSDEKLGGFREAWNQHTEKRDWDWGQDYSARHSDEQLENSVRKATAQAAALGCVELPPDRARHPPGDGPRSEYQEMLAEAAGREVTASDKNNGIDR